jgi:hypothetical protein
VVKSAWLCLDEAADCAAMHWTADLAAGPYEGIESLVGSGARCARLTSGPLRLELPACLYTLDSR